VLSFSLKSDDEDEFVTPVQLLGNVIICPEVAMANAAEDKIDTMDEIELLVAHGILHILGYSHNNEAEERAMNLRQSELVKAFHDGDSRR
jgi:probable rRNA maturation factor